MKLERLKKHIIEDKDIRNKIYGGLLTDEPIPTRSVDYHTNRTHDQPLGF